MALKSAWGDEMKADRQYKYVIEAPHFIEKIGRFFTGSVQANREMTDDEIFRLAKEMSNGVMPSGSRLVSIAMRPLR